MRALDDHRIKIFLERRNIGEKIRRMFRTKQVREYGDDTFIEVIVRAYMEKNDELRRNASNAFWEYRTAMKPVYKYQRYYNEVREKKRQNKAMRRKKKEPNA